MLTVLEVLCYYHVMLCLGSSTPAILKRISSLDDELIDILFVMYLIMYAFISDPHRCRIVFVILKDIDHERV